ncbi:MAG: A/G-specific adenine glycosylase [Planctomycetota bacterium]|nr:A/G-specific adenine glycosylase [Planctomycetota bacterium]
MVRKITTAVGDWFRQSHQQLPWRGVKDPYAIWLSEVMLQQTRVTTVIPYWNRFMKNYPDVQTLARAPRDEVLELWAGLGYYSRGQNLHKAAKMIVDDHAGQFPRDPEQVRKLPGIGEYTTAAICSIAFGQPLAVVDGNVERVLCRYLAIDGDPRKGDGRRRVQQAACDALDVDHPGDHNQALMDLGRSICTPRSPDCQRCPMASGCKARLSGQPTRWPQPRQKRTTEQQWWASAVVVQQQQVLVWTGEGELLGGHRGPPLVQLTGPEVDAEKLTREQLERLGIEDPLLLGHGDRFRHAITYRRLEIYPLLYQWNGEIPEGVSTIPIDRGDRLPSLHRKAIAAARELLLEVPR